MRRLLCLAVLATLVLAPPSALAQNDKKKPQNKNKVEAQIATAADYAALNNWKELAGYISNVDVSGNVLTFRVEYEVPESAANPQNPKDTPKNPKDTPKNPNPKNPNLKGIQDAQKAAQKAAQEEREQQQFRREYAEILRIKNPTEQQRRLQQLMQRVQRDKLQDYQEYVREQQRQQQQFQQQLAKGQPGTKNPGQPNVKMVKMAKEFELEMVKDVRVARSQLDADYDNKGNLVQYTPEELKKKRDDKMPGYKARFEDMMVGQQIKVYLAKRPAAPAKAPVKKEEKKDGDKDAEKEKVVAKEGAKDEKKDAKKDEKGGLEMPANVEHAGPRVTMILILTEAPIGPTPPKKKQK